MKDARQKMLQHAYATEDTGIPLVSGVPIELYRAALDEIRELRKPALASVELAAFIPSTAREVVLLLMAYPRDKCSNGAWASKLCADLGMDKHELTRELQRRRVESGAQDGE